jgi:hypothetical protein
MTARVVLRRIVAAIVVGSLTLQSASLAIAHSPDPPIAWPLFAADDVLQFRWMENEVPPLKMREAVVAAAGAAAASRASRAPTIAFAAGGTSTVEYGASVFCGANGLACADGWHAPGHFHVAFRTHGHQFDWGRLQWCQLQSTIANGCYDIENVALDEFGHVLGLGHHANYADESDYLDAVVQTVSRARPKAGWDADEFGRCDAAKLQLRYDMVNSARKFATCLDLATTLSLAVTDSSIQIGDTVTFTATVRVADVAVYERLRANLLSQRKVVLERRLPGASSWTTIATMPASTVASGTYQINVSPTATYEWRGYFLKPASEGLRASSSAPFAVTVSGCSSPPCPQFTVQDTQPEGQR